MIGVERLKSTNIIEDGMKVGPGKASVEYIID